MLIEAHALKHWMDHFYGYGSWDAKFWFVGYEEGGGDLPDEVAEKSRYLQRVHPAAQPTLCDIRELYKHVSFRIDGPRADVFSTMHDHRFGSHAVLHGYWKNMIAFECGYQGKEVPDQLAYQQKQFASTREALIPLYPLPTHSHAWYYSWLDLPQFPFLRSRALFQQHVFPNRIQCILNRMRSYKPELVLMYGMDNIIELKKSIQFSFPEAKFKTAKAIKNKIPQHHRADFAGTTLLITTQIPALRHNRVETGFDWYELGKVMKAG